jgi:hypothetical protein
VLEFISGVVPIPSGKMLHRHFARRDDLWEDVVVDSFPDIPTMVSEQERRYLYWLAKHFYTGRGRIVEVGTWLGGSSACLAAGLRDSGSNEILNCFDNFVWTKSYETMARGISLPEGGDFQSKFRVFVESKFSNVRSTKSELSDIKWSGGEIEVLFLDAPKNKTDMMFAIDAFFPSLIPGYSIVVFQDFFYSPAYEVPATICTLKGCLNLVHTVANSSTAAFSVDSAVATPAALSYDYDSFPLSVVVNRLSSLMNDMPKQAGDFLAVSVGMMLHDKGKTSQGIDFIRLRNLGLMGASRLRFLGTKSHIRRKYGALFDAFHAT